MFVVGGFQFKKYNIYKMDLNEDNLKTNIDPDYLSNSIFLRKAEKKDEENTLSSDRLINIVADEFDKELSARQKQLEEIEEQITKAQKLLHLVRYVLVTSYYKKKNLEYFSTGEEHTSMVFDSQNRIHPAIKKLLGKNSNLDVFTICGKRKAASKNCDSSESSSQATVAKKIKLKAKNNISKPQAVDGNQNCLKNRKKVRHRLIIGNISKYMPSSEDDNTTHKWMIYVRSDTNKLDVSTIIDKVIFYLHPSYKPHDIVEVVEPPFHLSRRGWGEFPLRVQIFFKCSLNKPVDIVHNLKLDKARIGRQVLGSETLVDVYLHENTYNTLLESFDKSETVNSPSKLDHDSQENNKQIAGIEIKEECLELTHNTEIKHESVELEDTLYNFDIPLDYPAIDSSHVSLKMEESSYEHNYCQDDTEKSIQNSNVNYSPPLDHSYSRSLSEDQITRVCLNTNETFISNNTTCHESNKLMYGLGDYYIENDTARAIIPQKESLPTSSIISPGQTIQILPSSFNKILLSNGHVIPLNLVVSQKPYTNIQFNLKSNPIVIDKEKYKIVLPKNRFKNLGEALLFLLRRLPLWHELARDIHFKNTYPFIAISKQEYESWNVGKRASSEWSRARTIKQILSTEKFPMINNWNTRTYFMYARSHGYCPFIKYGSLFANNSEDLSLINNMFLKSLPLKQSYLGVMLNDEIDINVDVESDTDFFSMKIVDKSDVIDASDPELKNHCTFIKEAALDCGVILKSEEIIEGVVVNAAERVILEAVKCFAENLIRRANHHLICKKESCYEVTPKEIQIALTERDEMKAISKFKINKRERDFFL